MSANRLIEVNAMKQVFSALLIAVLLVSVFPLAGNAAEKVETVYFDDGSFMTIEVNYTPVRATWSVTGNKQYTYYNSYSEAQWKVVLTGTYTYNGSTSSCTASSVDVTIYDSNWYTISKSTGKSGNNATASVTMGQKAGGLTVVRVPVSLNLSCDANGNLS